MLHARTPCVHRMVQGGVSSHAETIKINKYQQLENHYYFKPISIDTLGAYGTETKHLINEISAAIKRRSGNRLDGSKFRQRLLISIQKGNTIALKFAL